MLDRVLLYVTDTPGMAHTAAWTIKLARATSARIFAVAVVDPKEPPRVEERCWELLYGVEDDAFEQNVRVSLLLEQGEPLPRLLHLSASYEIDLVIVSSDSRLGILELIKQSNRPVVFVK
jgi:nucleotide-binding universal stress UspA family protein